MLVGYDVAMITVVLVGAVGLAWATLEFGGYLSQLRGLFGRATRAVERRGGDRR
ncbi:MAG: hypothetical protein J2P23_03375 [Microlunatus sp.]|nr:hypothetical protein [Microlunatus sp.]